MEDPIAPQPPPPPPAPPADQTAAAPPPQEPPPAAQPPYDGPPPDAEELAQADAAAAADAAVAAGVEGGTGVGIPAGGVEFTGEPEESAEPQIPSITAIPEAVRSVCLADGIPEAEFARDFPLPVEVRERLLVKVAENLTGHAYPVTDAVRNVAANLTTVGDLIDYFEEGHPDHPTATDQSER